MRMIFIVGLMLSMLSAPVLAGERPYNVSEEGHEWLEESLALEVLLQSEYGPIPGEHIFVAEELGEWGAWRSKSKHQGNDFVLDLPPGGDEGKVFVGAIFAGEVVNVEPSWGSYGNSVFLVSEGSPAFVVMMAHLDDIWVEVGESVEVGDYLGQFGCSGNCKGLSGDHIKNQVHVEMYEMPEGFEKGDVTWSSMPMRQLRGKAVHKKGKGDGIDLHPYWGDWGARVLPRAEIASRWEAQESEGGFDAYLESMESDVEVLPQGQGSAREVGEVRPKEPTEEEVESRQGEANVESPEIEEVLSEVDVAAALEVNALDEAAAAIASAEAALGGQEVAPPEEVSGVEGEEQAVKSLLETLDAIEE